MLYQVITSSRIYFPLIGIGYEVNRQIYHFVGDRSWLDFNRIQLSLVCAIVNK